MNIDERHIQDLVTRPAESFNVELKSWIDPDNPTGIAKIVRATLALRNRNGGYLVIGWWDNSRKSVAMLCKRVVPLSS